MPQFEIILSVSLCRVLIIHQLISSLIGVKQSLNANINGRMLNRRRLIMLFFRFVMLFVCGREIFVHLSLDSACEVSKQGIIFGSTIGHRSSFQIIIRKIQTLKINRFSSTYTLVAYILKL